MKATVNNYRIDTGFKRGPDDDANNLTLDVSDGLLNNPAYTKLPVSLTDLATFQTVFAASMIEARKGGADRIRAKNAAKLALTDALMKLAHYCMGETPHNLDALLSSGFDVVSTNRTSGPLDTPAINDILNSISGQLMVRGQSVLNGRLYKVRASTDGGKTWVDMGTFTGARHMLLQPTTPGTVYMIEVCALGGSTGQSQWSNPVSIMAT
jgi:hypothetical protein